MTVIDALDTIAEVRKRLRELSFAVSFIGGFVFLFGAGLDSSYRARVSGAAR